MDDINLKVFVGSIDFNATEKDIEEAFKPYGEVVHVVLLRDKETQKSRGFGFVTFKETHSVEAAIKGMHKQILFGRPIVVNYAARKTQTGGNSSTASTTQNSFNSQLNTGYGYGYDQQQTNPYYGYQAQQGYWNQQGYGWGAYWPQGYGNWAQHQGWNQQMQHHFAQQQSGQHNAMGQQQQHGLAQVPQQTYNKSGYSNSSHSSGY